MAYSTRDGGHNFKELIGIRNHCEFAGSHYEYPYSKYLIFCQIKDDKSFKYTLLSTTDEFQNDKRVLFDDIIGYMSNEKYSAITV